MCITQPQEDIEKICRRRFRIICDRCFAGSSFAMLVSGDRQGITEKCLKRIYDDATLTFMVDKDYKVMKYFENGLN